MENQEKKMTETVKIDEIVEITETVKVEPVKLISDIDITPHTVFVLCGPTFCGKSTFTKNLKDLVRYWGLSFKAISSDKLRTELLESSRLSPYATMGVDSRYSDGMMAASEGAFKLLREELKASLAYPINTDIVVVDTTGMNENFRNEIREISSAAKYRMVLVTFEYKYRSDYLPVRGDIEDGAVAISEGSIRKIESSVMRFRQYTLPRLNSRGYDARLRIKSRDSFGIGLNEGWAQTAISEFARNKIELALACGFQDYGRDPLADDKDPTYAVIGDSHECTKELRELIETLESTYPGIKIVHVGDYLDKGGDTVGMIEYMYERLGKGDIFVLGNHESYVVRKLRGELGKRGDSGMDPELEKEYFSSLSVLSTEGKSDVEKSQIQQVLKKLFILHDSAFPFVVLCDNRRDGSLPIIVTHAPCSNLYLGKVHDFALREQRNYRIVDRTKDIRDEFGWLYKEAAINHPIHIFGHVAHRVTKVGNMTGWQAHQGYKYRNKVFLDTGAVHGGELSAAIIKAGRIQSFYSVKCEGRGSKWQEEIAKLPENLGSGPVVTFNVEDYNLEFRDLKLLNQIMEKDVKYISGTMSPAPAWDGALETLEGAFRWFDKHGVKQVVLQPKYMGSRCQMYLFKEGPEKTFATSRAGWIIKGVEGKDEAGYKEFLTSVWYQYDDIIKMYGDIILDGELLPWRALGGELIDKTFYPYGNLVLSELETLSKDETFEKVLGKFFEDKGYTVDSKLSNLISYSKALNRYSVKEEPVFKAFDILSQGDNIPDIVKESNSRAFELVNSDEFRVVEWSDSVDDAVQKVMGFWTNLTIDRGMEGVVIKPLKKGDGPIPYIKVRSREYLRLVYGYDYTDPVRYDRLVRQKNISGKLRLSLDEHKAAMSMLTATGDAKKEIIVKLIGQMKQEAELDPRL